MSALPNIRAVRAEKDRSVVVTWKGGAEGVIDLSQHLAQCTVFAEVSADTLWRLALQQGAKWLKAWRTAHRIIQGEAAQALGVSPRMWRYYESG